LPRDPAFIFLYLSSPTHSFANAHQSRQVGPINRVTIFPQDPHLVSVSSVHISTDAPHLGHDRSSGLGFLISLLPGHSFLNTLILSIFYYIQYLNFYDVGHKKDLSLFWGYPLKGSGQPAPPCLFASGVNDSIKHAAQESCPPALIIYCNILINMKCKPFNYDIIFYKGF